LYNEVMGSGGRQGRGVAEAEDGRGVLIFRDQIFHCPFNEDVTQTEHLFSVSSILNLMPN